MSTVEEREEHADEFGSLGGTVCDLVDFEDWLVSPVDEDLSKAVPLPRSIEMNHLTKRGPLSRLEGPETRADRDSVGLSVRRSGAALAGPLVSAKVFAVQVRWNIQIELSFAIFAEHEAGGEASTSVSAPRAGSCDLRAGSAVLERSVSPPCQNTCTHELTKTREFSALVEFVALGEFHAVREGNLPRVRQVYNWDVGISFASLPLGSRRIERETASWVGLQVVRAYVHNVSKRTSAIATVTNLSACGHGWLSCRQCQPRGASNP